MAKEHTCVFRSNIDTPPELMQCAECGREENLEDLEKPRKRGNPYLIKEKPKGSTK